MLADYSNAGEIQSKGGTVTYTGVVNRISEEGELMDAEEGTYELLPATSWSSPEISLEEAIHLMNGGSDECADVEDRLLRPPLAYAYNTGDPNPSWDDLSFSEAIPEKCVMWMGNAP